MSRQRTIKSEVGIQGRGLFAGDPCRMRFKPAEADSGVVFVRTDEPSPVQIPISIENLAKRARRTSLLDGEVSVETIEHVMSAVVGMGVDNLIVEMSASETPSSDGSPLMFAEKLKEAGFEEQEAERRPFVIEEPVSINDGDRSIASLPGPSDCLEIIYELDYSDMPSIGRQVQSFRLGKDDYFEQIAPARTFLLKAEAEEALAKGIGTHQDASGLLIMDTDGPVDNELRFPDEHVRHKICDVIGDLALLGRPIYGRIVANRSGHDLNHQLVRRLAEQAEAQEMGKALIGEPVMDIRRIMRLLPHRYPFLMVDRLVELESDKRAIGVKNVTINEPFFQGHYPGLPIMPGVLILEALAQLSGILLSRRLEHTGKVAMLLSMDRVKMRRPARPGDQLVLIAEAIRVRSRTGHCRCHAKVGEEVAAEAEIKFMLVDAEPV